jgi:hypothetical protein
VALVPAKLMIGILQCSQLANFLFASKESSRVFSKVPEADIQKRLHKHIWGKGGSILLAAHDQPCLFSANKEANTRKDNYLHVKFYNKNNEHAA